MLKNITSVLIFLFNIFFLFFIINMYFSDNRKKQIKENRYIISKKNIDIIQKLPILLNDTNNVIEFNAGYEDLDSKIERNFWKLFKKND